MAQLVVRNLEADVTLKLQRRASRHGQSIEKEVRAILRNAVKAARALAYVVIRAALRRQFLVEADSEAPTGRA